MSKLECVLLVDDDDMTNFFNRKMIEKAGLKKVDVAVATDGKEAIEYLKKCGTMDSESIPAPGIIFLDINMPHMNGWEFLEAYEALDDSQKAKIVVAMLTTSLNPDDEIRARQNDNIGDFFTKPLQPEMITKLVEKHWPGMLAEQ